MWQWGATAGENIVDKLHGRGLAGSTKRLLYSLGLPCTGRLWSGKSGFHRARSARLTRWIPFATRISARAFRSQTKEIRANPPRRRSRDPAKSTQPFIFPGSDTEPERRRDRNPEMRCAALQPAAFIKGDGVEMNFDGAEYRRSPRPFSAIFFSSISSSILVSRAM